MKLLCMLLAQTVGITLCIMALEAWFYIPHSAERQSLFHIPHHGTWGHQEKTLSFLWERSGTDVKGSHKHRWNVAKEKYGPTQWKPDFTLVQVQDGLRCSPGITAVQLQQFMAQALPTTRNLQGLTSPTYQASGTARRTYSKTHSWTFYCTAAKIYALEELSSVWLHRKGNRGTQPGMPISVPHVTLSTFAPSLDQCLNLQYLSSTSACVMSSSAQPAPGEPGWMDNSFTEESSV